MILGVFRAWGSVESWRALRLPLFRALVADQLELALTETIFGRASRFRRGWRARGLPWLDVSTRVASQPGQGYGNR